MMEVFCENSWKNAVDYFHKKPLSKMYDRVLNTPLRIGGILGLWVAVYRFWAHLIWVAKFGKLRKFFL